MAAMTIVVILLFIAVVALTGFLLWAVDVTAQDLESLEKRIASLELKERYRI